MKRIDHSRVTPLFQALLFMFIVLPIRIVHADDQFKPFGECGELEQAQLVCGKAGTRTSYTSGVDCWILRKCMGDLKYRAPSVMRLKCDDLDVDGVEQRTPHVITFLPHRPIPPESRCVLEIQAADIQSSQEKDLLYGELERRGDLVLFEYTVQ